MSLTITTKVLYLEINFAVELWNLYSENNNISERNKDLWKMEIHILVVNINSQYC